MQTQRKPSAGWKAPAVLGGTLVLAVGLFLWQEHALGGGWGFPLDDTWIHMQIARNLQAGHGFSFNPGEPVSASTAPLWTLVLALLHLLPWNVVLPAKALGVLLLWANGLLTLALARSLGLGEGKALLGGMAVVLSPCLLWGSLSGMEVALYAALSTAGVWRHIACLDRRPSLLGTALFALAGLARPECLMLFPLAVLDRWRLARNLFELGRLYWRHVLLFAALLAPFAAFNYYTLRRFLPGAFYAKVGPYGLLGALQAVDAVQAAKAVLLYPVLQAQDLVRFSAENNILLACLAPLGLLWMLRGQGRGRRTSWLIPMVLAGFPVLRGMLAPFGGAMYQHGRYAANLVPLLAVTGVVGLGQALQFLSGGLDFSRMRRVQRWGMVGGSGLILLNLLVVDLRYARVYGQDVANINRMHVVMGRWLAQHTPVDAVIATHDIGAIGYFSRRRVLDTVGLATPEVLGYLRSGAPPDEGVLAFLLEQRPDYLVILPDWYPKLSRMHDFFQAVHEVVVEHRSITTGTRLVAYRTVWTGRRIEPGPGSGEGSP